MFKLERRFVVVPPLLKSGIAGPNICFFVLLCFYCCLIYNGSGKAFAGQGTLCWFPTVTFFTCVQRFRVDDAFVMRIDEFSHIIHTTVAHLNVVLVEYFVERTIFRKMFIY